MRVDACMVIFAVDPGNVIKRIVLRDCKAEKALIKNIRGADRPTVAVHRGIRLVAVKIAGLCRVGSIRRIGWGQIRITRDAVVLRCAAEGIGMNGKVSAARVEQHCAVKAIVDGGSRATELAANAAPRNVTSECDCWSSRRRRRSPASQNAMFRVRE